MFFRDFAGRHSLYMVCALFPLFGAAAAAPEVVVSIAPIHSLVAGVMKDVGEPALLMRANASPHTYQLRPSDARLLEKAQVIFWIGPTLETFLEGPLSKLATHAEKVALIDNPDLPLLESRKGGNWEDDNHHHEHTTAADPHIWLSPANAKIMVSQISNVLISHDRPNAHAYRRNSNALLARLDALGDEGRTLLAPVSGVPYLVFHDAFQYFEKFFGLNAVGAVTAQPSQAPSAYRIKTLRETIQLHGARCVFHEPQLSDAVLNVILEDTDARRGRLDPLGIEVEPGPQAYFELMTHNIQVISQCLGPQ